MPILKLPVTKVAYRACPGCSALIHQVEVAAIPYDMSCPRCNLHPLSEFVIAAVQRTNIIEWRLGYAPPRRL